MRPLHLPPEFCYISSQDERAKRRDGRAFCECKSKCFTDSHGGLLRGAQQGAPLPLSAGQVSAGVLMALSHNVSLRFMAVCVQMGNTELQVHSELFKTKRNAVSQLAQLTLVFIH